jgi:uncharacterized protein YjbI with pentapeptide repeats
MELKSIRGAVLFALDTAKTIAELVVAAVKINQSLRAADLQGADLQGADLQSADLQGADLQGAYLQGAYLHGADLRGAYLHGADLRGAELQGAYLRGAYLEGADLQGAYLHGAYLHGAYLQGAYLEDAEGKNNPIRAIRIFSGLYAYEVWAVLFEDGTRSIRMGCLWKSLAEWEKIGIRNSNLSEFPDDASPKCEERVAAFNFAKAAILRMQLPEAAKPAAKKAAEKALTK